MGKNAPTLLAENISALLKLKGWKQKDLAQWCGHTTPWLNAFLLGKRSIPIKTLDRIADFFGIATYQLFQPGVARTTERRRGQDRRAGLERRISHETRMVRELQNRLAAPKSRKADQDVDASPLGRLVADIEHRIARFVAQQEASERSARTGDEISHPRSRRRDPHRKNVERGQKSDTSGDKEHTDDENKDQKN